MGQLLREWLWQLKKTQTLWQTIQPPWLFPYSIVEELAKPGMKQQLRFTRPGNHYGDLRPCGWESCRTAYNASICFAKRTNPAWLTKWLTSSSEDGPCRIYTEPAVM
jgi:hypothetical protein